MRRAAAVAGFLVAAPAFARAPELVRWQDAAAHVGRVITIEGTVATARVTDGACLLEFAPDDPAALRVVLMIGLFSSPVAPERYAGHRVRASGRVQSFQGRPEMIIRRADQIEVMDAVSTTTTLPPPPAPPAVAPAPPAPPPTHPPGATSDDAGRPAATERCKQARSRLDAARRELAARTDDVGRCLRAATSRCQRERDAVAHALEALPAREAETDRACE